MELHWEEGPVNGPNFKIKTFFSSTNNIQYNLVLSLTGKTCVACLLLFFKYSKSRKTGSGHAAYSKLCYTIQFSILVLCAKYQKAGLSGSREKCDRNYLLSKFAYVHNIQSRVKQEVDMRQIQNCVARYSSPY